ELQTALGRFQEALRASTGQGDTPAQATEELRAFAEGVGALVVMLAPFAPHLAEELWELLGHRESIFRVPWPTADQALAREEAVEVVIQVNGRVRARLHVPRGMGEDRLKLLALEDARTRQWTQGKSVRKVIVVPDKLVNVVVAS
ncbi:MAG TPA: class I tRNA ligase family protein, partial [Candidatus Methylomirabilis sp.]|nr:class I tRNA ligase family protein [Candidatus Methylomirabilis sp.]